jgi:hypothetical protein
VLIACSAGVDDYRIVADNGSRGGSDAGRFEQGGKGASSPITPSGGSPGTGSQSGGGDVDASVGGSSSTGGAGVQSTGGSGNTGGQSTGGASLGGTGGTNTGGLNTGGSSTGGTATGGANTGGTGAPAIVGIGGKQLVGITAAAWDGTAFLALQSGANQFWRINPAGTPAVVAGPFPLPAGVVAPRAFGASSTTVYVIVDGKIYRGSSSAGFTSGTSVPSGLTGDLTGLRGLYASKWFLFAQPSRTTTARALEDGSSTLTVLNAFGNVGDIATDGISFAIVRAVNGSLSELHRVAPGDWTLNASPCNRGSFIDAPYPISVFYMRVAWAQQSNTVGAQVRFEKLENGTCSSQSTAFAYDGTGSPPPIALISETRALTVESGNPTIGKIAIHDLTTLQPTATVDVNLGNSGADSIVVGVGHALLVGDNFPVLVAF